MNKKIDSIFKRWPYCSQITIRAKKSLNLQSCSFHSICPHKHLVYFYTQNDILIDNIVCESVYVYVKQTFIHKISKLIWLWNETPVIPRH